jgi:hypothetical protein
MFRWLARRYHQRIVTQHLEELDKLSPQNKLEILSEIRDCIQLYTVSKNKEDTAKHYIQKGMQLRHLAISQGARSEANPVWLKGALLESLGLAYLNSYQGLQKWEAIRDKIERASQ